MLLQVLCKCESLEAEDANVLLDGLVARDVPAQREPRSVGLVAALGLTNIWLFHFD